MNNIITYQDMASFEVLHTQNNSSDSVSSADYSFLPEVSDGVVSNGDISHTNDKCNLTNMQSTLTAATHDSSVEVHSHLIELIDGNHSLKEALNKNNLIMREQMSTISAWRNNMILLKNQQDQSLQKAKEKVASVEQENVNLLQKLCVLEKKSQKEEIKDFCSKCETLETALNNLLGEKDFIEKNEDILSCELNNFHAHLQENLIEVCRHLDIILNSKMGGEEKKLLQTFVLLLKFKISSLNGDFCATVQTDEETGYEVVHQNAHKNETVEEHFQHSSQLYRDFEDLKESVKEKDKELNLLRKEKEEFAEKMKSYDFRIQELEMKSKAQFDLMTTKIDTQSSLTEKSKQRCESLQQQVEEYEVKLDRDAHQFREEIQNLQVILRLEQNANQKDKEELSKVMIKCEKLQVDYDRASKLLEIQSKDEKEKCEELTILRESDAKVCQETIDHLTAQLIEVQEQLAESNAEVVQMKQDFSEPENIPLLKAQVEAYKIDFLNISAAKDSACDEVERLSIELKKYEKKSESCPCKSCPPSTSRRSGRFSSDQNYENSEGKIFECPICNKGFKDMNAVQNHVNRCIKDPPTS